MFIDKLPGLIEKTFTSFWWLLVVGPAIAISTWSLTYLAYYKGHLPIALACLVSAVYDGGAIGAFHIALQWQRKYGTFGISAQFAAILFATSSFYLNWNHGVLIHLPVAVCYMLGMPPVVALITLELWLRFQHRGTLRKRPMPKPEAPAWFLFPFRSFRLLRLIVAARMDQLEETQIPIHNAMTTASTSEIRAWLFENGHKPGYVGRLRKEEIALYAKAMANGNHQNGNGQLSSAEVKELTDGSNELNLITLERY